MGIKVLKADCSAGAAYVEKTFSGPPYPDPLYVQFDLMIPSATLTALASQTSTADLLDVGSSSSDGFFVTGYDTSGTSHPFSFGNRNYWTEATSGNPVNGGFTADAWHVVKVSHVGSTITWNVDGTDLFSYALSFSHDAIYVGGHFASAISGQVYYMDNVKVGTTSGGTDVFSSDFESGVLTDWSSTTGSASVVDDPLGTGGPSTGSTAAPEGICLAFTNGPLDDPVTWTRIDNQAGVHVTEVSIDRGRGDERSKTNPGTVSIRGYDSVGALDPTNAGSPFSPNVRPVKQASINLYNPVSADWHMIFRGYVDTYKYTVDPSEKFMQFEITLVDMLDMLNDAEIIPDQAGNTVPSESVGDCFYTGQHCDDRLLAVLADSSSAFMASVWPASLLQIASGNVFVQGRVYSRGTSLLQVIDEACDAEYPGSTNRFITKNGSFAFRGRYYRFVPAFYAAANDAARAIGHELVHWDVGDLAAYKLDATLSVYSGLTFELGKTDLINTCMVTPIGITNAQIASGSQFASDSTSITNYGPRTSGMSLENLITGNADDGNTDLQETSSFASATVHNYKDPVTFVSELVFTNPPEDGSAQETNTWAILCGLELSDLVTVTSTHPGGGGFSAVDHYVESIKYQLAPLEGDTWHVTQTVGLSSKAHFTYTPPSWNVPAVS